jgi:hypothetical protein
MLHFTMPWTRTKAFVNFLMLRVVVKVWNAAGLMIETLSSCIYIYDMLYMGPLKPYPEKL